MRQTYEQSFGFHTLPDGSVIKVIVGVPLAPPPGDEMQTLDISMQVTQDLADPVAYAALRSRCAMPTRSFLDKLSCVFRFTSSLDGDEK